MAKLTFEAATLADVIKRAASVAPTRGEAFDKVAGIIFSINDTGVTVMATDTTVFYMEAITAISIEGDQTIWRLPSMILSSVVTKLPLGSGSIVTMDDASEYPKVVMRCGRTVVKLNLLDTQYYPMWDPIEHDDLQQVANLGSAIKKVLWATSNADAYLAGVAIRPDGVVATDRVRMARVELETGMDETVVVPGRILSRVIPDNGDVQVAHLGQGFLVCPNEYTQIRTIKMEGTYPPVERVLNMDLDTTSAFNKQHFLPMLTRGLDFVSGNRQATISLFIGAGELAVYMDNQEVGLFGDVCEMSGDAADHARIQIDFNPETLRDVINAFPGDAVTIRYNIDRKRKQGLAVQFTNDGNYNSIIQPMKPPTEAPKENA